MVPCIDGEELHGGHPHRPAIERSSTTSAKWAGVNNSEAVSRMANGAEGEHRARDSSPTREFTAFARWSSAARPVPEAAAERKSSMQTLRTRHELVPRRRLELFRGAGELESNTSSSWVLLNTCSYYLLADSRCY